MLKLYVQLMNRTTDERGAIAIEYALLALFVAVALILAFTTLKTEIANALGEVGDALPG